MKIEVLKECPDLSGAFCSGQVKEGDIVEGIYSYNVGAYLLISNCFWYVSFNYLYCLKVIKDEPEKLEEPKITGLAQLVGQPLKEAHFIFN